MLYSPVIFASLCLGSSTGEGILKANLLNLSLPTEKNAAGKNDWLAYQEKFGDAGLDAKIVVGSESENEAVKPQYGGKIEKAAEEALAKAKESIESETQDPEKVRIEENIAKVIVDDLKSLEEAGVKDIEDIEKTIVKDVVKELIQEGEDAGKEVGPEAKAAIAKAVKAAIATGVESAIEDENKTVALEQEAIAEAKQEIESATSDPELVKVQEDMAEVIVNELSKAKQEGLKDIDEIEERTTNAVVAVLIKDGEEAGEPIDAEGVAALKTQVGSAIKTAIDSEFAKKDKTVALEQEAIVEAKQEIESATSDPKLVKVQEDIAEAIVKELSKAQQEGLNDIDEIEKKATEAVAAVLIKDGEEAGETLDAKDVAALKTQVGSAIKIAIDSEAAKEEAAVKPEGALTKVELLLWLDTKDAEGSLYFDAFLRDIKSDTSAKYQLAKETQRRYIASEGISLDGAIYQEWKNLDGKKYAKALLYALEKKNPGFLTEEKRAEVGL